MTAELTRSQQHRSIEEKHPDLQKNIVALYNSILLGQNVEKPPSQQILNVGCGSTLWLENALQKFNPNIHFTSIDIAVGALLKARKTHPTMDIVLSDASTPPFEMDIFDAVIMNGCVGEIGPSKRKCLEAIRTLSFTLKPGGIMVIHTVSDKHAHLYEKYKVGTGWIVDGMTNMSEFERVCSFPTSDHYSLVMVLGHKSR